MSTTPEPLAASDADAHVGIKDDPRTTVRNPADLVRVIGYSLGITLVCLAVIYAHNTTEGVAADVRAFAGLLQRILFIPVTVLDTAVILIPPVAVGVDLAIRRHAAGLLQGLLGAVGGTIINVTFVFVLQQFDAISLATGLSIGQRGTLIVTIPAYVSAITGLLTAVGSPVKRRTVTWSWNLMWVAVVVSVVTTTSSLPGMVIAIFIGRCAGFAVRYAIGVASQRAYGQSLLAGIHRAGFAPVSIDRVPETPVKETQTAFAGVQTPQFFEDHRLYVMDTVADKTYNLIVLDGDRQVKGILSRVWSYLRSRGIEGRNTVSLRQTAERSALLSYAVRSAGVNTPAVLAIAQADDSMLIVREATSPSVNFAELKEEEITDDLVDLMWTELLKAHRCSIAHRALTPETFRITPDGAVMIIGWEAGDVASSSLARRMDHTQMVALIASRLGSARALASASRVLTDKQVAALGPLLQLPAVPKATRTLMTHPKEVLASLRAELAQDMPEAAIQQEKIARVNARTVVMVVLVTIALIAILATINLNEIIEAVRQSDWRWAVASFGVSMCGFIGAAMSLIAFSPVKLSLLRTSVCQLAATFVAVAAPAGIGSAAVNLRMFTRKAVPTALAAATVALNQVTTIVVGIVVLVIVAVITGSSQLSGFQVTPTMLIVIGVIAALIGLVFTIPFTRTWVIAKVTPMLRQTWPRLIEVVSSPVRLTLGVFGNIILIGSYVTAMYWAILAFGQHVPYMAASVVYLLGNSAGALIPTPGGMGAIEVTESGALVAIGINAGVAASIVLLFRFVTYWIRIPLGWLAYKYARKVGDL